MAQAIIWLGWACYLGAAVAILVYVIHFAGRQGWRRPWNAAGLFFTSIALSQTPYLFQAVTDRRGIRSAFVVTICLLAATGLQAFIALRRRKARVEDAAKDAPAPAHPADPSSGSSEGPTE